MPQTGAKPRRKKAINSPSDTDCTLYAKAVLSGAILAGDKMRKACERHLEDLSRKDLYFDEEEALRVVNFFELLPHIKGSWGSPTLVLEPWQKFYLGSIYGWKVKATGLRRFRTVYLQVARKNAKSTLAAGQGLYAFFEGEPGAEIYSAATTREQAKIIFEVAKAMVRKQSFLGKALKPLAHVITQEASNSRFSALSADAHSLDGLNSYVNLIDELHAHKDSLVWDVLETATGSRRQPLMIATTTAGFERAVCLELYKYAEQVLSKTLVDDSFFPMIYELDAEDDWQDSKNWIKANPNLGVSVFQLQLETLCTKAVAIPEQQNNFLCKHLNKWVNQKNRWINLDDWAACAGGYSEESLAGRKCFGGLDLSATTDLTAFVLVFPPEEEGELWKVVTRFWVPSEQVAKRAGGYMVDKVPYDAWLRDGHIKTTPGNTIDLQFIQTEILELAKVFTVKSINFDRYRSIETAGRLEEAGLEMAGTAQGALTFTEPMQRFHGLLLDRAFSHNSNPALSWMANNMVIRADSNMNIAPDKKAAKDRIDGIVALLMAFAGAINHLDKTSVYDKGEVWV